MARRDENPRTGGDVTTDVTRRRDFNPIFIFDESFIV